MRAPKSVWREQVALHRSSRLRARAEVGPHERWVAALAIAVLHATGAWVLTSLQSRPAPTAVAAPLQVDFVTLAPASPPVEAPATLAQPQPKTAPRPPQPRPVPVVATPAAADDTPAFVTPPAPHAPAAPQDVLPASPDAPPTSAVVAAAPPAPPPTPRVLPASAVAYLVPPPIEVPLASRRLGESGTVWLRVRVGRDGLPQQITLQRSSGFERLDRQAQEAMQRARFKPQIEDGQPIEWAVVAPLQYDLN